MKEKGVATSLRTKINAELLVYLNECVVDKFKASYENEVKEKYPKKTEAELYGFDNHDPRILPQDRLRNSHSIKLYVCNLAFPQKSVPDKYKEFDGKYLWKKKEEAKKSSPDSEITFSEEYLNLFLKYLGLNNINDLKIKYNNSFYDYIGYYLSFVGFRIRNISMQISIKSINEAGEYRTLIKGIHIRENAQDNEEYQGVARFEGKFIYSSLQGKGLGNDRVKRTLHLIGAVEPGNIEHKYIKASLQGTTHDDKIFSWEVFFYKVYKIQAEQARYKTLNPEGVFNSSVIFKKDQINDFSNICYYLSLHRNVISINGTKALTALSKLTSRGANIPIYTKLSGVYILWNFNFYNNKITQNIFVITIEGTAILYPYIPSNASNTLKAQRALINVSLANQFKQDIHKIIAITFALKSLNIVNVAMFDLPQKENSIINGSFSSLGFDVHGNLSGYFVMQKEKLAIDPINDFEGSQKTASSMVSEMNYDEALEYSGKNNLLNFFLALCELQKEKYPSVWHERRGEIDELISKINNKIEDIKKKAPTLRTPPTKE